MITLFFIPSQSSSVFFNTASCYYCHSPHLPTFPVRLCFSVPVAAGGEQRDGGRLQPAAPHLKLHQRAGLGLPPAEPEERPAAQALRRPQVRREED